MDAVIAFVDMNDLDWQRLYYFYAKNKIDVSRYRDWGTLKYVLRGIQYNMPFIDKVHLVLMQESQIPLWLNVNADNLHIVYHKDFVPAKYLPTFNCNTLELHLHKIPDLTEQFIYFNDDMVPIHPSVSTDYFIDDKVVMDFIKTPYQSWYAKASSGFYNICVSGENFARQLVGKNPIPYNDYTYRPVHTISPMLKTMNSYVYSQLSKDQIKKTCSIIRNRDNFNQYLYIDYLYHIGKLIIKDIKFKYISSYNRFLENAPDITPEKFKLMFEGLEDIQTICINDYYFPPKEINKYIKIANDFLESVLPLKSKYEV